MCLLQPRPGDTILQERLQTATSARVRSGADRHWKKRDALYTLCDGGENRQFQMSFLILRIIKRWTVRRRVSAQHRSLHCNRTRSGAMFLLEDFFTPRLWRLRSAGRIFNSTARA
jgi:hypothetical protein